MIKYIDYSIFVLPVSFNEWGKILLGRFQHVVSKKIVFYFTRRT